MQDKITGHHTSFKKEKFPLFIQHAPFSPCALSCKHSSQSQQIGTEHEAKGSVVPCRVVQMHPASRALGGSELQAGTIPPTAPMEGCCCTTLSENATCAPLQAKSAWRGVTKPWFWPHTVVAICPESLAWNTPCTHGSQCLRVFWTFSLTEHLHTCQAQFVPNCTFYIHSGRWLYIDIPCEMLETDRTKFFSHTYSCKYRGMPWTSIEPNEVNGITPDIHWCNWEQRLAHSPHNHIVQRR